MSSSLRTARPSLRASIPAASARRRFDLHQLLPFTNRREDETGDLQRFLACPKEVTGLPLAGADRFTDILNPYVAAELFVALMLQGLGNSFPFDLSVADQ